MEGPSLIGAQWFARERTYLGGDDQPIVVDPIRLRERWITDDDGYTHKETQVRSAQLDHEAMEGSKSWFVPQQGPVSFFKPTTRQLDVAAKWPIPQGIGCLLGMHGEIRDPSRFGKLPSIAQFIYDGSLSDKSKGDIEHEMREADRRQSHRLFDTSGYTR
jgi:hypothetical protein